MTLTVTLLYQYVLFNTASSIYSSYVPQRRRGSEAEEDQRAVVVARTEVAEAVEAEQRGPAAAGWPSAHHKKSEKCAMNQH